MRPGQRGRHLRHGHCRPVALGQPGAAIRSAVLARQRQGWLADPCWSRQHRSRKRLRLGRDQELRC
eukprot:5435565-Alexandrium_andersonii.AAC.1